MQRIVKEQYERCKQILLEHQEQLKLIAKTLLTEETLVAEQIRALFYDGELPEVDYDAAKVVKDEDTDYSDGKYGKSYDDIRKEQLDEGDEKEKEDRKENRDIEHERRRQHNEDHDYKGQESDQDSDSDVTGHEQSPNIENHMIQIIQIIDIKLNEVSFYSFFEEVGRDF